MTKVKISNLAQMACVKIISEIGLGRGKKLNTALLFSISAAEN